MVRQLLYVIVAGSCAVLIQSPQAAVGGELIPPVGPIQATNRVQLNEQWTTLPHTISQSGSYVLTSNLTGAGVDGIIIAADDVTLDLNGFALIGGSGRGVSVLPGVENLAVRDGTIRDWGIFGVGPQDQVNAPINGLYENLRISGNGNTGLFAGKNSVINNCGAIKNGNDGIVVGSGSIVMNSAAWENTVNGFVADEGCVFLNCSAVDNGPSSFADGFAVQSGCSLRGCSAHGNTANGVVSVGESVITECVFTNNGGFGIVAPTSLIRANLVASNTGGGCNVPGSTVIENHGCSPPCTPTSEVCDGIDNDCDLLVDEGCPGSPCSIDGECGSGFCRDGVCCDLACDGLCQGCTNARTGATDGVCAFIPDGTDPDGECPPPGSSGCDGSGGCGSECNTGLPGCPGVACTTGEDCLTGVCIGTICQ
jgi:hypothetical protein